MLKKIMVFISILLGLYILICALMFILQENLIFFPQKLDKDHQFNFAQPFEEVNIKTEDEKMLHGLLFKSDSSKGLIFYLHGNAGSLDAWGDVAETYTRLQHDIFLLDYRGYGKSEGRIESEEQLFKDVQAAYNEMLTRYREDNTIVLGYSIGTGPATKLAATNNPKLLILQAPYFSLTDMVKHTFPLVPPFLLKYKLETHQYIRHCRMPIILFHGDEDEVIPYSQSLKLKELLKESDTLITLNGIGHNGMTYDEEYVRGLESVIGDHNRKSEIRNQKSVIGNR
jgi:pimeloyl-ACP methyl ester carboxylesterase